MVSAITGEMVSSASSKAKPAAFWATARPKAINWSELMKEKAPAKASMPPQPARKLGKFTVAMVSERTGARRYRLPRVQWPEAWPSNAVGPVVFTAAPRQKFVISESTSASDGRHRMQGSGQ